MITLLNTFTLTDGDEAGFEEAFEEVARRMREQEGFVHHRLVHSLSDRSRYVNVATWTSVEAHEQAIGDEGFFSHLLTLGRYATPDPQLYETVQDLGEPARTGS